MRIISLEAENVKHLQAIKIKPDGSMIVIGGDNEEGKTCVLDCIEYGLGGASSIPPMPINIGKDKARIVLDLEDIVVTRTFTKSGTNLVVKNKDGATFPSPQAMLNKLVGELTFDPLEFSKMDAKGQTEVLKKLIGLDFDKVNFKYKKIFDERTVVNRQGRELKANLDSMTKHDDVPDEEVGIATLGVAYADAIEHNQKMKRDKDKLATDTSELKELQKRVIAMKKSVKDQEKALEGIVDIDAETLSFKMTGAEKINAQVRENKEYAAVNQKLVMLRKQSGALGDQMTKITEHKANLMAKAKFPIKGLEIGDDGVTFKGVPLVQCSSAQSIKISVAIGLAMNPKLKVLLIREGSLLDSKNLAVIAKMAEKAGAQIWIERVSKGKECQVIIQDGMVLEPEVSNV